MRRLFWAAAIGGGLYWASKQPGGISGVWNRMQGKMKEIQDSPHPMESLKNTFTGSKVEPASEYMELPEHATVG